MQAAFPWLFTGFFFALGAIVGSFLNVCIFRIPKGESVVSPGSHCACGKAIPFYLNIPVISWLFLRGKAACCGRKISARYPAVELLTALVFAAAWHFSPTWDIAVPAMIFSAFAIVLAFVDWDTMLLPDSVNSTFVLAGVACGAAFPQAIGEESVRAGFFAAVVGWCVGSMLIYWFRYFASLVLRREAMGEGDVVLLGGIGAFCGWGGALFAFFASAFIGLFAVALVKIFGRSRGSENFPAEEKSDSAREDFSDGDAENSDAVPAADSAFPLGPWLLIGAAVYLAFRAKIAEFFAAYTELF